MSKNNSTTKQQAENDLDLKWARARERLRKLLGEPYSVDGA